MSQVAYATELGVLVDNDAMVVLLLSQLVYWHGRTEKGVLRYGTARDKDGVYWLAKSAKELEKETLLTSKQIRRGVAVLSEAGIIITKLMRFMGHATLHIRFVCLDGKNDMMTTEKLLSSILQKGNLVMPKGQTKICQKGKLTTETTTETTKTLDSVPDGTTPEKISILKEQVGKNKVKNKGKNPSLNGFQTEEQTMKADDILTGHKAAKAAVLATPVVPTKTHEVVTRWKHQSAGLGIPVKDPLPAKEVGQFKLLLKALGPRTNEVIDYVFQNWDKFTSKTGSTTGIDLLPSQPSIGFLLMHYTIALQLIAKVQDKAQENAQLEQELIDKPAPLCNSAVSPVETKFMPSEEDIQDAFAQLEALQKQ